MWSPDAHGPAADVEDIPMAGEWRPAPAGGGLRARHRPDGQGVTVMKSIRVIVVASPSPVVRWTVRPTVYVPAAR
jgi:hypothetical protein